MTTPKPDALVGITKDLMGPIDGRTHGGALLRGMVAIVVLALIPALAGRELFAGLVLVFGVVGLYIYFRVVTSPYAAAAVNKQEHDRKYQSTQIPARPSPSQA